MKKTKVTKIIEFLESTVELLNDESSENEEGLYQPIKNLIETLMLKREQMVLENKHRKIIEVLDMFTYEDLKLWIDKNDFYTLQNFKNKEETIKISPDLWNESKYDDNDILYIHNYKTGFASQHKSFESVRLSVITWILRELDDEN